MKRRLQLLNRNPHCVYCGRPVDEENGTLDHQVPICKGGGGDRNLVLACRKCNGIKSCMPLKRWEEILPILKQSGYLLMSKKKRREWRLANPGILLYGTDLYLYERGLYKPKAIPSGNREHWYSLMEGP